MGFFAKLLGTIETAFQVGLGGPQLVNDTSAPPPQGGGALGAQNAAKTFYVPFRVGDAQGCDDAVNLETMNCTLDARLAPLEEAAAKQRRRRGLYR